MGVPGSPLVAPKEGELCLAKKGGLRLATEPNAYAEGAIAWALGKVGVTDYAFLCYAFVEDAYEFGNGIVLDGQGSTAGEAADAYGARGCRGVPPRGAYVFYDCFGTLKGEYRNWGHVGLSLGDGRVIHAWDQVRIDHFLGIEKLPPGPGFERPQCIGWTPVARILRGMTIPKGTAD